MTGTGSPISLSGSGIDNDKNDSEHGTAGRNIVENEPQKFSSYANITAPQLSEAVITAQSSSSSTKNIVNNDTTTNGVESDVDSRNKWSTVSYRNKSNSNRKKHPQVICNGDEATEDPPLYLIPIGNILQNIPSVSLAPEPISPTPKSTLKPVQVPYNPSDSSDPYKHMTSEHLKSEFYRKKLN
ncbi:hypothetical protein HHI36_016940 [Cryptolaemus montrouzieri]|uniref:Uncharacterized protein n=1 Tax=Cryptolaemus montrouzieri TaxID=559131 RepID=A0ABD2NLD1_9CUCU